MNEKGGQPMNTRTILQGFQWELPNDGTHWQNLQLEAPQIKMLGFTGIWLPPAYKGAAGKDDVGYGVYDLYDLGEFDQKGTVATKYGIKQDYLECIHTFHALDMEVYADVVFNHFLGADEEEEVEAVRYIQNDRTQEDGKSEMIKAWTKFTFPGRNGKYNDYIWTWKNFDGVDYDQRRHEHAVFGFAGKEWAKNVDTENGNYDYLMGADLDMKNPETVEQLNKWGTWFQDMTHVDGYRLDAVKHISFDFFVDWLRNRQRERGSQPLFVVGEYWSDELDKLLHYIDASGSLFTLFDVPLHFNLFKASSSDGQFDMSQIFTDTLVAHRPEWTTTFVDNHDTQKGQALESWVEGWFKSQAYALTLLRREGTPCVFYGDLYGIPTQNVAPVGDPLEIMLHVRRQLGHGAQKDYLDDPDVIGWTCMGDLAHENSGFAVILTDRIGGEKEMSLSALNGGETYIDCLGNRKEEITLNKEGVGIFPVNDGSISVWVNKKVKEELKLHLKVSAVKNDTDTV